MTEGNVSENDTEDQLALNTMATLSSSLNEVKIYYPNFVCLVIYSLKVNKVQLFRTLAVTHVVFTHFVLFSWFFYPVPFLYDYVYILAK